jgi:hypothetical protein
MAGAKVREIVLSERFSEQSGAHRRGVLMKTEGMPYAALTRFLRSLGPDVSSCAFTFGELHAAMGQRLPMGAEIASAWDETCTLGRAVAVAGFSAKLSSTDRGWVVTFTRRAAPVGSRLSRSLFRC